MLGQVLISISAQVMMTVAVLCVGNEERDVPELPCLPSSQVQLARDGKGMQKFEITVTMFLTELRADQKIPEFCTNLRAGPKRRGGIGSTPKEAYRSINLRVSHETM
ncbi:hypothetical protein TURU_149714 [Turdus rufiventris]|nr:hypothetical protein TURU_149714 [Turdus rufiventris]